MIDEDPIETITVNVDAHKSDGYFGLLSLAVVRMSEFLPGMAEVKRDESECTADEAWYLHHGYSHIHDDGQSIQGTFVFVRQR